MTESPRAKKGEGRAGLWRAGIGAGGKAGSMSTRCRPGEGGVDKSDKTPINAVNVVKSKGYDGVWRPELDAPGLISVPFWGGSVRATEDELEQRESSGAELRGMSLLRRVWSLRDVGSKRCVGCGSARR